jgi:hypothetical protein
MAFALLVAIVWVDRSIDAQSSSVAVLSTEVSARQNQEQAIETAQASAALLSADSSKVDSYSIAQDGEVDFIDNLESTARALGLSVTVNTVGIVSANDLSPAGFENIEVRLTVSGSWKSVYQFTAEMENLPYDIVVNQADFSSLSDNTDTSTWQGAFDILAIKKISPTESQ